jgi:small ligand-binding sensory domain FIST
MASSGHAPGQNRLLFNDHVVTSGTVGVAMAGAVKICTAVSQGCRPIGERFIITKAEGNIIHELGGSSALDRLQEVFEGLNPQDQQQARTKIMAGCAMDEYKQELGRGDFLIRGLVGVDRSSGSIALGDVVKEGQTVQFQLRDEKSASEDLNLVLAGVKGQLPGVEVNGALLFSCNGRGQRFFGRPHHDVSSLRERIGEVPVGGFFAAGEIGPVGSMNFLHGYTASVALFCQAPDTTSDS